MKARVYCSRNQKEESSPLLRLDIFNPLVVNSDRSDAKRHKKSWTCTFMECLSARLSGSLTHSLARLFSFFFGPAGIQLHHSSENGSSDYRKGKHGPRGFVYERSAVRSPYITNQDAPSPRPPPLQSPKAHYSLWMLSHLRVGWGRRVFRFRHSTQHTGPRLFV